MLDHTRVIHSIQGKEALSTSWVSLLILQEPPRNVFPRESIIITCSGHLYVFRKRACLWTLPSSHQNLCSYLLIPVSRRHTHWERCEKINGGPGPGSDGASLLHLLCDTGYSYKCGGNGWNSYLRTLQRRYQRTDWGSIGIIRTTELAMSSPCSSLQCPLALTQRSPKPRSRHLCWQRTRKSLLMLCEEQEWGL